MRGSEGAMAFKCPALSKQILRDLPSKIIKPSQERSGAVFLSGREQQSEDTGDGDARKIHVHSHGTGY